MREYLIQHTADPFVWTSLTIDPSDTHALVYRQEGISTLTTENAMSVLDYCRQSPDFTVQEIN